MLKHYIKTTEALKRLRKDAAGVVSFEYVIVAACIVVAVSVAFGVAGTTGVGKALTDAIAAIALKVAAAVS